MTKRQPFTPKPETLAMRKVPSNPIDGLGEFTPRRPSPFFWHPPTLHPYGERQVLARTTSRACPGTAEAFTAAYTHPELIPIAEIRPSANPAKITALGIAPMHPLYVFAPSIDTKGSVMT